jgi:hypothetical protein
MKNNILLYIISILLFSCSNKDENEIVYTGFSNNAQTDVNREIDYLSRKHFNLNDSFYLKSKFNENDVIDLNSNSRFQYYSPYSEDYTFPFHWDDGFPQTSFVLCTILKKDYDIFIICYSHASTASYKYETYLFTFTKLGKLNQMIQLPDFIVGYPDAPSYTYSNFVKKYKNAGYTEFQIIGNSINCNSTYLTVYNNGSEEINNFNYKYFISDKGIVGKHKLFEDKVIYYKNGNFDHSIDDHIVLFK